ncbi:MAG: hypothetical protein ABIO70_25735 [Pseudomonadota bacterium]
MQKVPKDKRFRTFSPDILQGCREVFEPRCGHPLTESDCQEITNNLVGFFETLIEWRDADLVREGRAESAEDDTE